MEGGGFDVWVRERFHVESSDIQDIASHLDPCLLEDWTLPSGVDDLFSWLNTSQDVAMEEQQGAADVNPQAAAAAQAAAAGPSAQPPVSAPPQHQVSSWQLDYLQQTMQQPMDAPQGLLPTQYHDYYQQQQLLQQQIVLGASYPQACHPGAGFLPAADVGGFLQHQQQLDPSTAQYGWPIGAGDALAAAAAAAAGDAGYCADPAGMQPALQHAGSNASRGSSHPSSGSSQRQQQQAQGKGSRAPVGKQPGRARKPRKVTDAQRAAHKRFRQRRKEQVAELVAEVASKQAQLQALEAEHEALSAKARALDQLVASAGDSVMLMQRMESLSLEPKQQGQQQQQLEQQPAAAPAAAASSAAADTASAATSSGAGSASLSAPSTTGDAGQEGQSAVEPTTAAAAAAAGAAATAAGGGTPSQELGEGPSDAVQLQNSQPAGAHPTLDSKGSSGSPTTSTAAAAAACPEQLDNTAAAAELAAAVLRGSSDSSSGCCCPGSPSAAAAASLERLEAAVRTALGRPVLPPLQQQQDLQQQRQLQQLQGARVQQQQLQQQLRVPGAAGSQGLQLQGTLPALQRLTKSLVSEIMQLVLQVNKEQVAAGQLALAGTAAGAGTGAEAGAAAGAGGAAAAAGGTSAAAARLLRIRQQVWGEFRAFAATNRIDICLLYALNLETGMLVRPPPGHWRSSAQLLIQRLDAQTLRDIVVGHKLFGDALHKVAQQRHVLLTQLHAALREATSASASSYNTDSLYSHSDYIGPRSSAVQLLNAIDSNLRREYVMEGVFQWSANKLLPPMVSAELVVTSYPYLADYHHIATELMLLLPPQPDLAAATQAVQQQQQGAYPGQDMPPGGGAGYFLEQQQQPAYEQQQAVSQLLAYADPTQQPQQFAAYPQYQQQQYQQQLLVQQQGYALGRQVSTGVLPGSQPGLMGLPFLSTPCG